jgi:signal transduction histidine kinase
MPSEAPTRNKTFSEDHSKTDRRKTIRRQEDRLREQTHREKARKLHSLLELGQIIGLDLQLNEMLLQIAQKASDVMEADRCSVFLFDSETDELWSMVALGMGGEVIRMSSNAGIGGCSFQTGEVINLADAYADPRFNKEVDARTGYHTRSVLCMPLYNREGSRLGVIQLLNKKTGVFTQEDETFLRTFGNHTSFFIEMAQLQKAKLDALEQSRLELERLNKAKSKALDHLSHELRTPIAVIQGNLRILKRKLQQETSLMGEEKFFRTLEKHLDHLLDIQQETDRILRTYQEGEEGYLPDRFREKAAVFFEPIALVPFSERRLEKIKGRATHRDLHYQIQGKRDLAVPMAPRILEEILEGLLKNAIENTPDEGLIRILVEQEGPKVLLRVQDFGIGITPENQRYIFDGLFPTQDAGLYSSKRPYDFNAGGKGLDLLQMKVYGQRYGLELSMEGQRCIHIPSDQDVCPGKITACPHCQTREDCLKSGGSIFTVSFPRDVEGYNGEVDVNGKIIEER